MSKRVLFIAMAVVLSVATGLLSHAWLSRTPPRQATITTGRTSSSTVRVLVVNSEMPAGSLIGRDQLGWRTWPAESSASFIRQGQARASDYEGAVLRSRFAAGQPLMADQVARPGERGFMAAVLAPGDSAVTVNVTPSSGMAGFIFPGDRVDVLLTMTVPSAANSSPRRMSETILSNLRVVGIDQTLSDDKKTDKKDVTVPKTVTLEVAPKQAEIVALAAESGVISLSLKSLPGGAAAIEPVMTPTWDSEITHITPEPTAVSARTVRPSQVFAPRTVTVFRGGQGDAAQPPALSLVGGRS